jgi:hypothetical protein
MYKIFYSIVFFSVLLSCTEKNSQKTAIDSQRKFQKQKHSNTGVILTENISLYDMDQKITGIVKDVYGLVVEMDSISVLKYDLDNTKDKCNLHNFVKIKSPRINGWVYGKFLFEQENKNRDTVFTIDGVMFKITPTKNFNIGVYDEEEKMLSFCSETQSPVLFYNGKSKINQYLPIKDYTEYYKEGYLTLDDHDGWTDLIKGIHFSDNILVLNIQRGYQEGFADIEIEINTNKNPAVAKIIKATKTE